MSKTTPRHIIIKYLKSSDKGNLKSSQRKRNLLTRNQEKDEISHWNYASKKTVEQHFKILGEREG